MGNSKLTKLDFSKVILEEAIVVESSIKNPDKIFDRNLIDSFKTEFNLNPNFSIEQKAIKIDLKVHCIALNEEGNTLRIEGKFFLEFTFSVEEMEFHLVPIGKENKMMPSMALMAPLAGTAYSTARGMIIMKVLGTPLEGFSMPILNVQALFSNTKDIENEKKDSIKNKDQPKRQGTTTKSKIL